MLIWDDDENRVRYWSCKQEYEKSLQVKKQGCKRINLNRLIIWPTERCNENMGSNKEYLEEMGKDCDSESR